MRRATNSVIESWVDVLADVAAINRGEALGGGDAYTVNGRIYRIEPSGRVYPVSGPGIHRLNRRAFQALGVYNEFGLTDRAEWILDRMGAPADDREAARRAWRAEHEERP